MPELIRTRGYPVEEHTVTTSDGYILGLRRIPHGFNKAEGTENPKPVVFLMHGSLSSSDIFVLNNPNESLGFILADIGYDVWMGNSRGNIYSRKHIKLSPETAEFWDFRQDDISLKDVPESIDYVLQNTGKTKLNYIGYSMGTLCCMSMLSAMPEYNEKILKCYFIAPVAVVYVNRPFNAEIDAYFRQLLLKAFAPTQSVFPTPESIKEKIDEGFCTNPETAPVSFMFTIDFKNNPRIDQSMVPLYKSVYPAGSSTYVFFNFLQNILSKKFDYYDFGPEKNKKLYGQSTAPPFPLEKVTVPVVLFSSVSDTFDTPKGVDFVRQRLPNIVGDYVITEPDFDHPDFVFSTDATKLVYPFVLKELAETNGLNKTVV